MITGFLKILNVLKSLFQVFCLISLILFFSAGSLPQYLDFWQNSPVEIVENSETETSSDKKESKEKESDKFIDRFIFFGFADKYELPSVSQEYKFLHGLFVTNSTPPPESV